MHFAEPEIPPRLAPLLAQWDYMAGILTERLADLGDEEYLWEPAPEVWPRRGMPATAEPVAPRTIKWSICHLGQTGLLRADYLDGDRKLTEGDVPWPDTAAEGLDLLERGLTRWRTALEGMNDTDLDTIGRSAFPWGLDPELPLLDIVWWQNKELIYHAGEIWLLRDLYPTLK
jgi:DinB superfamily